MKNVLLIIQYDGTFFSGWQKQPGRRTVQGEIEKVLTKLCCQTIEINGTSRTDTGVHAYGQAATFKGDYAIPVENIKKAANNLLPEDIYILSAEEVDDDFHARFSSKGKTYEYKILYTKEKDIFSRNYYYNICKELDIASMKKACGYFIGSHDFRAFMSSGSNITDTVREIYDLNISVKKKTASKEEIIIKVTGNGFLYNMVRIITGTLVEVGLKKIEPEEIMDIIESKNRNMAGHIAPAGGLYLKEIYFSDLQKGENI